MNRVLEITTIVLCLAFVNKSEAAGQTIEKIKEANVADPIKIVVFPDGFRDGRELDLIYPDAVRAIIKKLFSKAPFDSLAHLFEVYRVSIASQDSGISLPGHKIKTFFGVYLDGSPMLSEISRSRLDSLRYELLPTYEPQRDASLLLTQSDDFKGGSYLRDRISLAPVYHHLAPVIVWHELGGHILGYSPDDNSTLGDEYYASIYDEYGDNFPEDIFPNITRKNKEQLAHILPQDIKWYDLLTAGIELPSRWIEENNNKIGLFAIDSTGASNLFIPSTKCIMRVNHNEFCGTCKKAIRIAVGKIYKMKLLAADLDQNGTVDMNDFALFRVAFGARKKEYNWLRKADFNKDGVVDYSDFFVLVESFGKVSGYKKVKPAAYTSVISPHIFLYIPFIPPN